MSQQPKPPKTYDLFVERFPALGEAWDASRKAEEGGSFDERTQRLIKLGIAIGSRGEGPVHSAVRKALAAGVSREEAEQVVALSASTIGLPSAVAAFSWILDEVEKKTK